MQNQQKMTSENDINTAAQTLLQNPQFMELFQRALLHSNDDSNKSTVAAAGEMVADATKAHTLKS